MSATHSRSGAAARNARFDEVLADSDTGHPDGGPAALAPDHAGDAGRSHQPLHALAPDPDAVGHPQLGVDHGRSVDLAVLAVDLADALAQPLVLERPRGRLASGPGVIARPRDLQHAAHRLDGVLGPLRGDEPEHRHRVPLSLAKKAAAFFKISRSSARIRFSRRSRRSSSRSSLLRPSRRPSSMSIWRAQLRSDCGETPSSEASTGTDLPLRLSNSTASRRNSNGYGAGMNTDPHCQTRRPSDQVSTKPGELQSASAVEIWSRPVGGNGE